MLEEHTHSFWTLLYIYTIYTYMCELKWQMSVFAVGRRVHNLLLLNNCSGTIPFCISAIPHSSLMEFFGNGINTLSNIKWNHVWLCSPVLAVVVSGSSVDRPGWPHYTTARMVHIRRWTQFWCRSFLLSEHDTCNNKRYWYRDNRIWKANIASGNIRSHESCLDIMRLYSYWTI